jgi:hypothetical protein
VQDVTHLNAPALPSHILWDIYNYLHPTIQIGVDDTPIFANALAQNVPNPFNPSTRIEFTVKERSPVTLRIYNVRGQRVKTLVDDVRVPGITHRVTWDGRNDAGERVASGVYFYRISTKEFVKTRKMVLIE